MKSLFGDKIPGIGMRIIKSAVAVLLCFLFYAFFRKGGIIFYSQLAALWCIQPQKNNMFSKAKQRTIGTMTGAVFGLIVVLIDKNFITVDFMGNVLYDILVSFTIILVIYVTILINKKDASYFSCVVFLSIVVNHIGDANPYIFVLNRIMDTMIGIIIGIGVNSFHLPYRREKDILFVSGVDDTLLSPDKKMSPYSVVELNRMIDDGANFTVATRRTPASLMEPLRDIKMKLPVIAMDGAVMYDIRKNEYIYAYEISESMTSKIVNLLDEFDINYFINMIVDNMLVIQYKELKNIAEQSIYDNLHSSPYRNYTTCNLLGLSNCIYFMFIDKTEVVEEILEKLSCEGLEQKLRIVSYPSEDYPGFSYIKIYNRNATRENMIEYLKNMTKLERTVTFGSIPGKYDILITEHDNNKVVKTLKEMFEPVIWKKSR